MRDDELSRLLEQASNVFTLAGALGRSFAEVSTSRVVFYDASIWNARASDFEQFWQSLLQMRDPMRNPPDQFVVVSEQLLKAARIAKEIRQNIRPKAEDAKWDGSPMAVALGIKDTGPPQFTAFYECSAALSSVSQSGFDAIRQVSSSNQLDDPFAFVSKSEAASSEVTGTHLEALQAVMSELDLWNSLNSPSVSGYIVEAVQDGHPLHVAVSRLQRYYGGSLPRPAITRWRKFLRFTRDDDGSAEDESLRWTPKTGQVDKVESFGLVRDRRSSVRRGWR